MLSDKKTQRLWDIHNPEFIRNPVPFFHRLQEETSIYQTPKGDWILTRYEDVRLALTNNAFGVICMADEVASRPYKNELDQKRGQITAEGFRKWLLYLNPPYHTQLKTAIMKCWRKRDFEKIIENETNLAFEAIMHKESFDFVKELGYKIPFISFQKFIGLPEEDILYLVKQNARMTVFFEPAYTLPQLEDAIKAGNELVEYAENIIESRRTNNEDDFITDLINYNENGYSLSQEELLSTIILFIVGVGENSLNYVNGTTLYLLQNKNELELLDNDVAVRSAVDEMLRVLTPFQFTVRRMTQDFTIRDKTLKANDRVIVSLAAANFDREFFEEPEKINLLRKNNPHFTLGKADHFCAGATFAKSEGKHLISNLIKYKDKLELVSYKYKKQQCQRGLSELIVKVKPSS